MQTSPPGTCQEPLTQLSADLCSLQLQAPRALSPGGSLICTGVLGCHGGSWGWVTCCQAWGWGLVLGRDTVPACGSEGHPLLQPRPLGTKGGQEPCCIPPPAPLKPVHGYGWCSRARSGVRPRGEPGA